MNPPYWVWFLAGIVLLLVILVLVGHPAHVGMIEVSHD